MINEPFQLQLHVNNYLVHVIFNVLKKDLTETVNLAQKN